MVTKMTAENAAKYSVLFDKANTLLPTANIQALDQYYSKIKTLVDEATKAKDKDPLAFARLPLDEEFFEIDANTRQIIIPPSFRSGIGVQGDNFAEVVYFKINRFFDAIDLATANIVIQWINAANQSGVSIAYDKSVWVEEEKIVFGWPIYHEITQTPGRLQFSVRFYTAENPDQLLPGTITYNFNTLPAFISINSSLNFDLSEITPQNKRGEMLDRIQDSPIAGIITPNIPKAGYINAEGEFHFFDNTNEILPTEIENNSTLKVMGVSSDAGNLKYYWYYQSYDEGATIEEIEADAPFNWFESCSNQKHSQYLVYYRKKLDSETTITGIPGMENGTTAGEFLLADNVDPDTFERLKGNYYIRYNAYKPNKGAGMYNVSIVNEVFNQKASISSNNCQIRKPTPIVIKNDTGKPVYFEIYEDSRKSEVSGSTAWIGHPEDVTPPNNLVRIEVDRNGVSEHDKDKFQWYKGDNAVTELTSDPTYTITTEGTYHCVVTRNRNGIEISKSSYDIIAVFRPLSLENITKTEYDASNPGYAFVGEIIDGASKQPTFNRTADLSIQVRPRELASSRQPIKTIKYGWYIVNGPEKILYREGSAVLDATNNITTIVLAGGSIATEKMVVECHFTMTKGDIPDQTDGFSTFTIITKQLLAK